MKPVSVSQLPLSWAAFVILGYAFAIAYLAWGAGSPVRIHRQTDTS